MTLLKKKLGSSELEVTVLGLGTVELGLEYGIGKKEVPSEQTAITILKTAIDAGINYIDTARGYGLSEERIGKSGIGKIPDIVIGTKCGMPLEKGIDPHGDELKQLIVGDVEESLRKLQTDSLQLLQLHYATAEQIERGEIADILRELINSGKVQHVGISTRGEEAPLVAIKTNFFETLQLAHSVVDQRMVANVMTEAMKNDVGIINRSVLLKGSLTPTRREQLPEQLSVLKENSRQAEKIATELGMDLPTLAMRFVISNPAVSTALMGTTKPERIAGMVAAVSAGPLPDDVLVKLRELAIEDPMQVDPAKWPKV
ncbi:MAG: aldo/keto reductase [bacterium]|nr:aldo/keto reductase [bacterium]